MLFRIRGALAGCSAIVAMAVVSFLFPYVEASACTSPPENMYLEHKEAIEHAEWIVVAKMKGREQRPTPNDRRRKEARFALLEVVEYLKGSGPEVVAVRTNEQYWARDDSKEPAEANYYGHQASSFWAFGGRSYNSPDCRIHPSFLFSDHLYLVFGPGQYSVGYENVTKDDHWVEFVREQVTDSDTVSAPFPVSAETYFENAKAVVHLSAVWRNDGPMLETDVLKGPTLPYFEMIYVSPGASMARKLDPECKGGRDSFPGRRQEKIDVLVVFEFLPNDAIRLHDSVDCAGRDRDGWANIRGHGIFSTNGHRSFPVFGDKVDLGEWSPVIDGNGHDIVTMTLSEIREIASSQ